MTATAHTEETTDSRFGRMMHSQALLEAETRDEWLVDGLILSSSTLIYGEAKVGKSRLVSALIAALSSGADFLGRPVPQNRAFSVAVCWTDDGGAADYAGQIQSALPDGITPTADYYTLPSMRLTEEWPALYDEVIRNGNNVVVIDNLTQCLTGSINSDDVIREFFGGIRQFTRVGIPVVIIGHSSDKTGDSGWKSDKPMGSSTIRQACRWLCFVKRSRKGNLTLSFSGNTAEPHELTVKHGPGGAQFEVIDESSATQLRAATEAKNQQRSAETLDKYSEQADFVVAECQRMSVRDTADKLAERYGGSSNTHRANLTTRGLKRLLSRTGEGSSTRWTRVRPAAAG